MPRKPPKTLRPMKTAPTDGTPIDLWSDAYGWIDAVWFDKDYHHPDGWVTSCPRPFSGWRPLRLAA